LFVLKHIFGFCVAKPCFSTCCITKHMIFYIMPLCNISQIATGVPYSESPRNKSQSAPILINIGCWFDLFRTSSRFSFIRSGVDFVDFGICVASGVFLFSSFLHCLCIRCRIRQSWCPCPSVGAYLVAYTHVMFKTVVAMAFFDDCWQCVWRCLTMFCDDWWTCFWWCLPCFWWLLTFVWRCGYTVFWRGVTMFLTSVEHVFL
jgi:hypothetical protein